MEETLLHGLDAIVGATCVAGVYFHRGSTYFDEKRKVQVSKGNGISSKIISHFPKYRDYSSSIDHFLEGVGGTLLIGGVLGLGYAALKTFAKVEDIAPIIPYYLGAATLAFKKIQWDYISTMKRLESYNFNDTMQLVADVASIITPIAIVRQYF